MASPGASASLPHLPAELHVKIITLLPAAQVCHLRRVCKRLQAVVDDNEKDIARPYLLTHRARLDTTLCYLTDPTLDLIDSFVRYAAYYNHHLQIDTFLDQFYSTLPQCQLMLFSNWHYEALMTGLSRFVNCHRLCHDFRKPDRVSFWSKYLCDPSSLLLRVVMEAKAAEPDLASLAEIYNCVKGPWPLASDGGAKVKEMVMKPDWSSQAPEEVTSHKPDFDQPLVIMSPNAAEVLGLQRAEEGLQGGLFYRPVSVAMAQLAREAGVNGELSPLKKAVLMASVVIGGNP